MKIKVIPNPKKDWALGVAKEVEQLVKSRGHTVSKKDADVTICIGGDGTILYVNHKGKISGSVLAIGSDSSHICQLHINTWKDMIFAYLGSGKTEEYVMLKASVGIKDYSVLNDVVIHTHDYRTIKLDVHIVTYKKGPTTLLLNPFEGDGVIVSTAIGSTAYAYSAGGEVILPQTSELIEVVPICPYKRRFKPISIDKESDITISSDRTADFIVDGIYIKRLKENENVKVTYGKMISFLIK
ncbi:MAG: hypothetical protein ABII22_01605 [Candidatus Micrarchaeota archaeon]